MIESSTNLPAAVEALNAERLLTPPTLDELDSYRTAIVRVGLRLHDFVGLMLYWEQRLRPDRYDMAASWAQSNFDVSTSTVTRWRTNAQKKYHLGPPTAVSAGVQRASVATKARNAKPQLVDRSAKTRPTSDLPRRETGRAAPIDATSHLAAMGVAPKNGTASANGNGLAEPKGEVTYMVTVPARDGALLEALLESQHRHWSYTCTAVHTPPTNGSRRIEEVQPRLKNMR